MLRRAAVSSGRVAEVAQKIMRLPNASDPPFGRLGCESSVSGRSMGHRPLKLAGHLGETRNRLSDLW